MGVFPDMTVAEVMFREVTTIGLDEHAGALTELFARDLAALVVDDAHRLVGILTKMDLVDHLTGSRRGDGRASAAGIGASAGA